MAVRAVERFWLTVAKRTWGVYAITHVPSGRQYIGATSCMQRRWRSHTSALKHGTHYAKAMQKDWNKDGAEAFEFSILLKTPPGDEAAIDSAERLFTAEYQPVYNQDGPAARMGRDPHGWFDDWQFHAARAGLLR